MSEDQELVQEAKVNSMENFLLVFSGPLEEEVMKTENTNKAFFERFFSDEDFRGWRARDDSLRRHLARLWFAVDDVHAAERKQPLPLGVEAVVVLEDERDELVSVH